METIKQHFEGGDILDLITDGELVRDAVIGYESWQNLEAICRATVEERSAQEFLGRKTCGDLCGRAMELLSEKHHVKTPKCWILIMRLLRQGGKSKLRPPAPPTLEEALFGRVGGYREYCDEQERSIRELFKDEIEGAKKRGIHLEIRPKYKP